MSAEIVATLTKLSNAIDTVITNGKKRAIDKRTIGHYKSTLDRLNKCWDQYKEAYNKIKPKSIDEETLSDLETTFTELDFKVADYSADLYDGIVEKTNPPHSDGNQVNAVGTPSGQSNQSAVPTGAAATQAAYMHLPRIQLPKFDGNYDGWNTFRDLFVSMVHNDKTIENVQKLHYLKGCLTKEAERILKNTPVTNEDYLPAWDKLKRRYENKRILVNTQVTRLINQEKLKVESSKGLLSICDVTEETLQQLKSLKVEVSHWDTLIIHILVKRLPIDTIKLWEKEISSTEETEKLPTLADLTKFLQTRARVLECVANTIGATPQQHTKSFHASRNDNTIIQKKEFKCPLCQEGHFLTRCNKFVEMSVLKRKDYIGKTKRCFNCFSRNHLLNSCTSKFTCSKCNQKHHSMLHVEQSQSNAYTVTENPTTEDGPSCSNTKVYFNQRFNNALLATTLVNIKDHKGQLKTVRCLVDPGSQASFITKRMVKELGKKSRPLKVEINGLNSNQTVVTEGELTLQLMSRVKPDVTIEGTFLTIDAIADELPSQSLSKERKWKHLSGLQLADPHYWKARSVDMLLGAEIYAQIIEPEVIKGSSGGPAALNTAFGWILLGGNVNDHQVQSFATFAETIQEINCNIQRFWESEEIPTKRMLTAEENQCERHYESTHERLPNGQYQVRLPFKEPPNLGSSRALAYRQYEGLERRFLKNPKLKEEYSKCFEEYIALGHMCPTLATPDDGYHIPHHAVFKDSTTTKLRIVFNATALSNNGKSLNEQLLTGPTLQPKLFATLLKWRKHKVAITGDIEKMYRMISMHPDDRKYHMLLWGNDQTNDIIDYQLNTVTFGTTSAPYLAIRTLQQLATDERDRFPIASKVAVEDFYVDDLLTGADDEESARVIRNECIQMLKTAHFNLRKWSSNRRSLLRDLPEEDVETSNFLQLNEDESVKTLGIHWVPKTDTFSFIVKEKPNRDKLTKRIILSEIASLYDPLGWIAPVIIRAKMIMQEIWISGCDWDDTVKETIKNKWMAFKTQLKKLEQLKIPRWIGYTTTVKNMQLHGFSDASIQAYGAAVYFCVEVNEQKLTTLLTAKTKVAPIKPVTIPRLELCGAVMLAKLITQTNRDMGLNVHDIVAWTDSTIVLHWIKSHARNWKTYVANRVALIQELVKPENWKHVPTEDNPADLVSRGEEIEKLLEDSLWWTGPGWLREAEENWPIQDKSISTIDLEAKTKVMTALPTLIDESLLNRYSSFTRLKRVVATLKRFVHNCLHSEQRITSPLMLTEIEVAEKIIIKQVQHMYFCDEIKSLKKWGLNREPLKKNGRTGIWCGYPIASKSKLLQLTPFLDNDGIMRVGGRLEHANIEYETKHPMILPPDHHLTQVIIRETHINTLHGGTTLVLNTIRQRYWIVNGKRAVTNVLNQCPICIRFRQKTRHQIMGNLPSVRVNMSRVFENVGIDFAGPITIKTSNLRNAKCTKAYFCIFVCMATKAIHLEVVSSLSTDAFIAALKRFVSRRGICKNIYSDNGTNFKGASRVLDKELKEAIAQITEKVVNEYLHKLSISWHFNPPAGSHHGGLWESNIKSTKYHLVRVVGKQNLTFEELTTVLTQIEAMLNSRPLCRIENSVEDLDILTPGHFLIGQPLNAIPEKQVLQEGSLHRRWKHLQQLTQQFWKQWRTTYLNSLQNKPKWFKPQPNLQLGDIVIIKDEQTHPTVWPLGKIIKTYEGIDHQVRVVDVKTANNIVNRPITKLCSIPTAPC